MSSEPLSILMASGPMPPEEVVRLGQAIAEKLHDVHGELWPSTISVSDDGTVGILPPGEADRSRYGQYAAPERILGKPATYASDVFSLGAILYHALSGRPPFRGDSPAAVMLAACTEAPLPMPAGVPKPLEAILMRCLHKDPVQRYASATAFANALHAYLNQGTFAGKRILVADDDAPIRDLYAQMAARIGVEADVVASGRDAIEALKTRRYDVALLDLNMPRLSGWEVLDFLRSRYESRPRHVYIVTGFTNQHISEADREVVSAVLYKPVVPDELRTLVTESLRSAKLDLRTILRQTSHRAVSAV